MTDSLHTTLYRVGGHLISIAHLPAEPPEALLPSFKPFRIDYAGGGEGAVLFTLTIAHGSEETAPAEVDATGQEIHFEWEDAQCAITPWGDGCHRISITPWGEAVAFTMDCTGHFAHCTAHLPIRRAAARRAFALNNFLMMVYAFRAATRHTLLMHASVVVNGGSACLFLGKSGTGKSTHPSVAGAHPRQPPRQR